MSEVVLKLSGVSRYFIAGRVMALDGVDLSIRRGETVGIAGASGSGKSTLLNLMATFDFATAGRVEVLGQPIRPGRDYARLRRESLGFVFQLHNLLPHLTLTENVALPLYPAGLGRRECRRRAEAMLERVGLGPRRDFRPVCCSGGERQRAAVARALVNKPTIILADEPTGNLDSENGLLVFRLMRNLAAAENATLLVATHCGELSRELDRRVLLAGGKIIGPE